MKLSLLATGAVASSLLMQFSALCAYAQDQSGTTYTKTIIESSSTSSPSGSESSSSVSGVMGFKHANKFAPKYRERLKTYRDQIQMGLTKGWLTQQQADHFSAELVRLAALEEKVAQTNYAQPGLDDVEKQFTQFNIEFSRAGSSPPPSAAKPVVPAKPITVPKPAAKATKTATTASKPKAGSAKVVPTKKK